MKFKFVKESHVRSCLKFEKTISRFFFLMWATLFLALLSVTSANVYADPQSKSYSVWDVDESSVAASFSITAREITRLPEAFNADLSAVLAQYLTKQLSVKGCELDDDIKALRAPSGYVRVEIQFNCTAPITQLEISNHAFFNLAPGHLHYAQVRWPGHDSEERLFSRFKMIHQVSLSGTDGVGVGDSSNEDSNTFAAYVTFGVEHILIGTDHIAFLLTLLLLIRSFKEVVFVVTGFTLGHSITLCLSTLGLATPNGALVESLIGFTIALVAAENIAARIQRCSTVGWFAAVGLLSLAAMSLWFGQQGMAISLVGLAIFTLCYFMLSSDEEHARKMRPLITASFGLIHGFGFSSVLMEVGVPKDSLLSALFGFNLGVEIGQIIIVAILSLCGFVVFRLFSKQRYLMVDVMSTLLLAVGSYWFLGRAFLII